MGGALGRGKKHRASLMRHGSYGGPLVHAPAAQNCYLGHSTVWVERFNDLSGSVREVALYNAAFTPAQVRQGGWERCGGRSAADRLHRAYAVHGGLLYDASRGAAHAQAR